MSARVTGNLARIRAALPGRVRRAVIRSALIVQAEIKLQLSRSRSPSPPGEPPGVVTGTLRRSVQVDLSGIGNPNPRARVGPGVYYAPFLEYGTSRMLPRPFVRPAVKVVQQRVLAQFDPKVLLAP